MHVNLVLATGQKSHKVAEMAIKLPVEECWFLVDPEMGNIIYWYPHRCRLQLNQ